MKTEFPRLSEEGMRATLGHPHASISAKILDHLDSNCLAFLAHSPFCCLATSDETGACDNSPRGDHPGFVRALDERTLVIPDRLGNQLADSHVNILRNGHVGLVCFVPGMIETLRVNGSAYLTDDEDLLAMLEQDGVVPSLATVIRVEEAYLHCGRALLRSGLWDPEMQDLAAELPTSGTFWAEASGLAPEAAAEIDAGMVGAYRTLY
ncbi:MSMEG_1061 family FMN-dependent PPOX-type flavoprotein [Herbiconiux liukaitaii]|uniref:MSMEG_1061 family FMN-dependent PPOX-type flavoprotein n=1 Tax=Herbiconiux liukaitaii TaxID=3342799 RepID=UPI0035BA2644